MRKSDIKQMKRFVVTLLKIRCDVKRTSGWGAPIDFKPTDFKEELFDLEGTTKENFLKKMVSEIQNDWDFLRKNDMRDYMLTVTPKDNGHFEIAGCTTDLLRAYLKKITGNASIFDKGTNSSGQQIVTVWGEKTEVPISGQQYSVFCYLLKNFNKEVSHEKLFSAIKRGSLHGADHWEPYRDESKKMKLVNETINNLRDTLEKAGKAYATENVIENRRGGIYRMVA